ncbi:MAG: hypothetical protein A3G15_04060 [Candidatus Levybacteria bacterium RIFCSPLOWO2_12_FULL_40_10]|nr:MAG: hypothetical protein A3G15_04060 [Candidatus Levybacteria bacterium RIFCSPLOWO2_12_FULL_40_10]
MLKKLKILLDNEIDPAYAKRAEFIFQTVEREKPIRILDVGCGRGFYVNALSLYDFPKEIIGLDINKEYLEEARRYASDMRAKFIRKSVYSINYTNNYFDLVICSELLEHLSYDKKALSEIFRVLKKGGTLIVTVPSEDFPLFWDPVNWVLMRFFNTHINKDVWFLAGIWAGHERLYNMKNLSRIIEEAGFSILEMSGVISFSWPFSHFLLYGLGKNIVERLNVKSLNRFELKKNNIKIFLAKLFSYPTKLSIGDSSVDIIVLAKKN